MKNLLHLLLSLLVFFMLFNTHCLIAQEEHHPKFQEIDFAFETKDTHTLFDFMDMPIGIHFNYAPLLEKSELIIQDFNCAHEFQLQYHIGKLFCELSELAKQSGIKLKVISSYRSLDLQEVILRKYGDKRAEAPGYSEHHLGTVVDIKGMTKNSKSFLWMLEHAFDSGWIPTYYFREGSIIQQEPWHWRFVGEDAAFKFYTIWEVEIKAEKSRLVNFIGEL